MIENDKQFIDMLRESTGTFTAWELRRRLNPYHSEDQIEFEALIINLRLNEIDQEVIQYANKNGVLLLTSNNPAVREYAERLMPMLQQASQEELINLLKVEESRIKKRLKELDNE